MTVAAKPKILCVDDEPAVLEGLQLTLGRRYRVETATGGTPGLELLGREPDIVAVISDMRMPNMNGAAFLAKARVVVPDATRILLTGQADMNSAIAAVNEGQIFRFLTKPCPPPALLAAVEAAHEQHRLITAERVLLEQTLHGSIQALADVLAIVNPVAFGRAGRIKKTAGELAQRLAVQPRWQLEVAAMLWPLGLIGVSAETAEKLFYGHQLDDAERAACARAPEVIEQLIGHIPRLEEVRAILAAVARNYKAKDTERGLVHRGASILRVAIDLDTLETQGIDCALAIGTLRGRNDYDAEVLDALAELRAPAAVAQEVRELLISALRPGMVFADDVKLASGALLVARGGEVTVGFLARVRNFPDGALKPRIRVIVPVEKAAK